MKTDSIEVGRVLQDSRRFTVPIYQRQYAWREDRLQPFLDDLFGKATELMDSIPRFQHYMGALILSPGADGYSVGQLSTVQVVDGQQRLTTFLLFLAALRSVAEEKGVASLVERLEVYIFHDARMAPPDASLADRARLLPTPSDREIFSDLLTKDLDSVRSLHPEYFYKNGSSKIGASPRALLAFLYFRHQIVEWTEFGSLKSENEGLIIATEEVNEQEASKVEHQRLKSLADALLVQFKLVIISLEDGDDAQVIFETLNSRGEPLLAMDLVRNNIFHRAQAQGEAPEKLFETRWKPYDDPFWKADAPRAKPKRPRIDHFLSFALTAQTGQETSLRELYAEYRAFARPRGQSRFDTVEAELDALLRFNSTYESLERLEGDPDLSWLGSGLVDQSQKMTVAARAMAERKTVGHRS